jgi:hypothetical protein
VLVSRINYYGKNSSSIVESVGLDREWVAVASGCLGIVNQFSHS